MRIRVLLMVLLVIASMPLAAQQTASIRGTIVDSQGETVSGARVASVNVDTGVEQSATTNAVGTYQISNLLVGTYVITVEAEGFKTFVTQNVVLSVAETRRIDAQLEIGDVTEAVTVTSSAVVVETIGGEVAGLITGEQVRELPLNGRNFLQLTQLMPGVNTMDNFDVKNKGLIGGSDMSVAGSRATGNMFLVDGANNNDAGSNRTILVYPSLEAVEEFKVHRNSYGAEFGGAGGAQVNLVTRGGTNSLRGSVFYFGRRGSWNETNYILDRAGAEPDDLTRDDMGFTLGGAFIKDKLHYFASVEDNAEVRGVGRTAQVPTAAERQGDFSQTSAACWGIPTDPLTGQPFPGNVIPSDRIEEAGVAYMNLYPLPNNSSTGGCENWVQSLNVPIDWRQYNARLDWSVTDRARVMVRYTQDDWANNAPTAGDANGLWGDDAFPALDSNWLQPSDSLVAQVNNVIGSSAINTFTFSKSGNEINIEQAGNSALQEQVRTLNPPGFPIDGKLSAPNTGHPLFWGGGGLQALWQAGPWDNQMEHQILKDDYEQVFGKHVLKAGLLYGNSNKAEPPNSGSSAEMQLYWGAAGLNGWGGGNTGNIVSDFLLEDMRFGFSEISTNQPGKVEWTDIEGYVADSWKIKSNMTFDYGVRISRLLWPESDIADIYLNFNPDRWDPALGGSACNGLMQVPGSNACGEAGLAGATNGPNAALINDNTNIAPRLGFAWDVKSDGRSVFRAGFGQFYQRERVSPNLGFYNNPPAVQFMSGQRDLTGENIGAGTGLGVPSRGFDVDANNPYMYQYNLTWEQRVGRDSTIELSYVGSQGRDLLRPQDANQIPAGADVNSNGVDDRVDYVRCPAGDAGCRSEFRPFGVYGDNDITLWGTDGSSDYDSIQAQYITRFGRGSQFQASYTLADFTANTSMTDSSGNINNDSGVTDNGNFGLDDADANMFRKHVLNASLIYNLPTLAGQGGAKEWLLGNWSVGGILIYASGTPLTVYAPNPSGDLDIHPATIGYNNNARPLLTGGSCSGGGDDLQIINPGAFTMNGYQIGNVAQQSSRGQCTGPDFFQTDLSLYKNFPFMDRFNVQLRIEIFNLFNTVNLIGNNGVETNFNTPLTLDGPRDSATQVVDTGAPASNFGRATRARDARQFQLGIKFTF